MNRNGIAVIATIFVGLLLILSAVALFYVNTSGSGSSIGESLIVTPIGGSIFDQFTGGSSSPPRIVQISGISGSSGGSSSSGGSNPPNPPGAPISNAGVDQTVNEGTLVTLNGAGSSDPNGDALTYSWAQITGPTVTLSSTTAISPTFTAPIVTSNIILTFTLTVSDGTLTGLDVVNINVNDNAGGGNNAPVASNLNAAVNEDASIVLTLVASDVDGNALVYSIVSAPTSGTLSAILGDQVTYTPSSNFNGVDTFTFKANDGIVDSNIATVTMTVNPISDNPFWINVANTVSGGIDPAAGTIIYPFLADLAGDFDVVTNGDVLTTSVVTTGLPYTLSFDANGNLVIGETNGYFGTDTVTVRVTDSAGANSDVSFQLNVKTEICFLDDCFIYG